MPEQHIKIFEALGVPKETIDKIEALTPETLKDFKADDYTGIISGTYEKKFLNDAGFLGKIDITKLPEESTKKVQTVQYERFLNEIKDVAKELDIDTTGIDDATQRQLKNFARTVIQKYGEKKGTHTEAITKLQADLQKAMQEKATIETGLPTKISEAVTAEKTKFGSLLQRTLARSVLSGIEGLTATPEYITDTVLAKVAAKYTPVLNEATLTIDLMQKDNPQLKALDKTGKELLFKDIATEILTADNMIAKKDEKDKTKEKKTFIIGGGDENPTVVIAGSDKIQKAMEAEAKNKTT